MTASPDSQRMSRLLEAGRALVADLDPHAVLDRTLAAAREVTGAQYAALVVLNEETTGWEQLLTLGDGGAEGPNADETSARAALDLLVEEPRSLRLNDFGADPRSGAFPTGHPVMRGFLAAPILLRGAVRGALYVAEKQGGAFAEADEEAVVILAEWAATAIDNARLYEGSKRRRVEGGKADRAGMTRQMTIGGQTGLERVLEVLISRGRALIDTRSEEASTTVTEDDEQLLRLFAASAATAVAMAQSVESDRLRSLIAAADAERSRWARELHDETLQGLGALRLLLAAARRRGDAEHTALTVEEAIGHIENEIENLHAIISDLRPAALDELGLRPALEALLERGGAQGGVSIASTLRLPDSQSRESRLEPEIESTVYRLVQEAVTNVVKHADAHNMRVEVIAREDQVHVLVQDDGAGFRVDDRTSGFGLAGMRERVFVVGGTLAVDAGPGGTAVRASLPARARDPELGVPEGGSRTQRPLP
jgi:signal transduction histidine kinase